MEKINGTCDVARGVWKGGLTLQWWYNDLHTRIQYKQLRSRRFSKNPSTLCSDCPLLLSDLAFLSRHLHLSHLPLLYPSVQSIWFSMGEIQIIFLASQRRAITMAIHKILPFRYSYHSNSLGIFSYRWFSLFRIIFWYGNLSLI